METSPEVIYRNLFYFNILKFFIRLINFIHSSNLEVNIPQTYITKDIVIFDESARDKNIMRDYLRIKYPGILGWSYTTKVSVDTQVVRKTYKGYIGIWERPLGYDVPEGEAKAFEKQCILFIDKGSSFHYQKDGSTPLRVPNKG